MLQGGTAYLEISANIENGKLASVLGVTHQALGSFAANPISQDQLSWAKLERASDFALRRMKNQSVASLVLARARMGQSLDVADYRRELESVSAEDVQTAFQYCLRANPNLVDRR